jgi:hypothetical protein
MVNYLDKIFEEEREAGPDLIARIYGYYEATSLVVRYFFKWNDVTQLLEPQILTEPVEGIEEVKRAIYGFADEFRDRTEIWEKAHTTITKALSEATELNDIQQQMILDLMNNPEYLVATLEEQLKSRDEDQF